MLAFYVEWHMREAWRELMFADTDQAAKATRDPVAPAKRSASAQRKASVVDQSSATELMLENPTLVKRPVLEAGDRIVVGFSEPIYRNLFPGREASAA